MSAFFSRLRKFLIEVQRRAGVAVTLVIGLTAILGSVATVLTNIDSIQAFWQHHFTPSHDAIVLNELQNNGDKQLIEAVVREKMNDKLRGGVFVNFPTHFIGVILRAKFADGKNLDDDDHRNGLRSLSVEPENTGFPETRYSPIGPEFARLPGRSLAWVGIVPYW